MRLRDLLYDGCFEMEKSVMSDQKSDMRKHRSLKNLFAKTYSTLSATSLQARRKGPKSLASTCSATCSKSSAGIFNRSDSLFCSFRSEVVRLDTSVD